MVLQSAYSCIVTTWHKHTHTITAKATRIDKPAWIRFIISCRTCSTLISNSSLENYCSKWQYRPPWPSDQLEIDWPCVLGIPVPTSRDCVVAIVHIVVFVYTPLPPPIQTVLEVIWGVHITAEHRHKRLQTAIVSTFLSTWRNEFVDGWFCLNCDVWWHLKRRRHQVSFDQYVVVKRFGCCSCKMSVPNSLTISVYTESQLVGRRMSCAILSKSTIEKCLWNRWATRVACKQVLSKSISVTTWYSLVKFVVALAILECLFYTNYKWCCCSHSPKQ